MRLNAWAVWLVLWAVLAPACLTAAADAPVAPATEPERITITTKVPPREVRDYKVELAVNSSALVEGSKTPIDLAAAFSIKIRHQYGRRQGEGALPLEVSFIGGQITMQGQKLEVTPSLYPKLTVLLDKDWRVTEVYGISSSSLEQAPPGISYGNLVMFFYLLGADQPRAVGETWTSQLKISGLDETYDFSNKLKRIESVDGVRVAIVEQQVLRAPKKNGSAKADRMKATAESAFAIDNGKLLKSHIECEASSAVVQKVTSKADIAFVEAPKQGVGN